VTNKDVERLVYAAYRQRIREVVTSLLAGNDTQCFTAEQYVAEYVRRYYKGQEGFGREVLTEWTVKGRRPLYRKQLEDSDMVREVSPEVWAAKAECREGGG
jgi:hypothetical protein